MGLCVSIKALRTVFSYYEGEWPEFLEPFGYTIGSGYNPDHKLYISDIAKKFGAEVTWRAAISLDWTQPEVVGQLFPVVLKSVKRIRHMTDSPLSHTLITDLELPLSKEAAQLIVDTASDQVLAHPDRKHFAKLCAWCAIHSCAKLLVEPKAIHAISSAREAARAARYYEQDRLIKRYNEILGDIDCHNMPYVQEQREKLIRESSLAEEQTELLCQTVDLMGI